jgi:hypothetical protein
VVSGRGPGSETICGDPAERHRTQEVRAVTTAHIINNLDATPLSSWRGLHSGIHECEWQSPGRLAAASSEIGARWQGHDLVHCRTGARQIRTEIEPGCLRVKTKRPTTFYQLEMNQRTQHFPRRAPAQLNEAAPVNAPIALRFQFGHPCRRV